MMAGDIERTTPDMTADLATLIEAEAQRVTALGTGQLETREGLKVFELLYRFKLQTLVLEGSIRAGGRKLAAERARVLLQQCEQLSNAIDLWHLSP